MFEETFVRRFVILQRLFLFFFALLWCFFFQLFATGVLLTKSATKLDRKVLPNKI